MGGRDIVENNYKVGPHSFPRSCKVQWETGKKGGVGGSRIRVVIFLEEGRSYHSRSDCSIKYKKRLVTSY